MNKAWTAIINIGYLVAIIVCANIYSTEDVLKWTAILSLWKFAVVNEGRTA